jgi:hypothetical protein
VQSALADSAGFIIAPFPVSIGDHDESLADDLPAAALYVKLPGEAMASPPDLVAVTGVLRVEATRVSDGRILAARIDVK